MEHGAVTAAESGGVLEQARLLDAVSEAARRSQEYFLRTQHPDGLEVGRVIPYRRLAEASLLTDGGQRPGTPRP
ncbi:MAG TPA: hypothetical protein VFT91_09835 [Dehalococcoidia bacterium]|nr:hypothetical protein [Dehalococcoidia bacterium]